MSCCRWCGCGMQPYCLCGTLRRQKCGCMLMTPACSASRQAPSSHTCGLGLLQQAGKQPQPQQQLTHRQQLAAVVSTCCRMRLSMGCHAGMKCAMGAARVQLQLMQQLIPWDRLACIAPLTLASWPGWYSKWPCRCCCCCRACAWQPKCNVQPKGSCSCRLWSGRPHWWDHRRQSDEQGVCRQCPARGACCSSGWRLWWQLEQQQQCCRLRGPCTEDTCWAGCGACAEAQEHHGACQTLPGWLSRRCCAAARPACLPAAALAQPATESAAAAAAAVPGHRGA
ncbi:hypothetical protein COO60DRAFT_404432 [Scenedesmus sp. NREL 46B-D3]|nr:hypothetical protein COO60DRAFT_404432 [Scenedesmus sp. NREL 46B-D3]